MNPADVVIATITLARTVEEERELQESLTELQRCGSPVIAADGGSPVGFVEKVRNLGVQVVWPRNRGLVPQVKAALRQTAKKYSGRFVLYTEPDKYPFFGKMMHDFVRLARGESDLGVAIAARDEKSFRTFPAGQRWTETFTNEVASLYFGRSDTPADYCYGPLLLSPKGVALALKAPDELGWGWRFYTMALAQKNLLRVETISGKFPCPPEQRTEDSPEDRLYRVKQLSQNLAALSLAFENKKPALQAAGRANVPRNTAHSRGKG